MLCLSNPCYMLFNLKVLPALQVQLALRFLNMSSTPLDIQAHQIFTQLEFKSSVHCHLGIQESGKLHIPTNIVHTEAQETLSCINSQSKCLYNSISYSCTIFLVNVCEVAHTLYMTDDTARHYQQMTLSHALFKF